MVKRIKNWEILEQLKLIFKLQLKLINYTKITNNKRIYIKYK